MDTHIKKKTFFLATDSVLAKTGFGRSAKSLLEYLHKLDRYNLVHFCIGTVVGDPNLDRPPWKSIASVDPNIVGQLKQQNPPQHFEQIDRLAGYGHYTLENALREVRPDVAVFQQDPWAFPDLENRDWFNKITSVFSLTLDSLPILNSAQITCPKSKHYWLWADFATKALHKLGHTHARTVRGPLETKHFYRLPDSKRRELRQSFNIPQDAFVGGFVFRNQLRKSVPQLLIGFKQFQKENPTINSKLVLFTNWFEGWDIPGLIKENQLNQNDILTAYICKACGKYEVKPFAGNDLDCRFCHAQKSQTTTGPALGITEEELCQVYNLFDYYVHPFTSGGQEIPIQEAKLCELITLVTNYSCGEDNCVEEACSLPLDWASYFEPGTNFIKATTYSSSICKQIKKVYDMPLAKRLEWGKRARKWAIDNFSIEVIGKQFEDFIDAQPFSDYDWKEPVVIRDPNYTPSNNENDAEWIEELYNKVLGRNSDPDGKKYWLNELSKVS